MSLEEKILSVLTDIKSLVKYQVQLLETVSGNIDEMLKTRKNFNPKQQMEAIQNAIPGNLDLGKLFASMVNVKSKPAKEEKE